MSVVGDKHIAGKHLFHHRMPSFFDVNDAFFIDGGPDVTVPLRHEGKGTEYIKPCHGFGGSLNPFHFPCNSVPNPAKHIVFQGKQLVLRV